MIDRGKLEVRRVARVAIDDFDDEEVARIYLAAAVFWLSEYRGAAFYVHVAQADFCSGILRAAGLTAGLLEKELQFT